MIKWVGLLFVLVLVFSLYWFWDEDDSLENNDADITDSFLSEDNLEEQIQITDRYTLPLSGSVPTIDIKHIIPLADIRQGCFQQDCIPSIDKPEFISVTTAKKLLAPESLGIALIYKNEARFYPFPMLETHELVNDVVAGDPLLVSYCPLCGTGIVFERTLDGKAVEFGVSGMLWQSNLLMYNRAEQITERNLWSQVLGKAVVGERAGQPLTVVDSDIMRFAEWSKLYPDSLVLNGESKDPYNGKYYEVASRFNPDYVAGESFLKPDEYIYGIEVDGVFKAYPKSILPVGITTDVVNDVKLTILNENGFVVFKTEAGETLPDVEGFWFSWTSVHSETLIFEII